MEQLEQRPLTRAALFAADCGDRDLERSLAEPVSYTHLPESAVFPIFFSKIALPQSSSIPSCVILQRRRLRSPGRRL